MLCPHRGAHRSPQHDKPLIRNFRPEFIASLSWGQDVARTGSLPQGQTPRSDVDCPGHAGTPATSSVGAFVMGVSGFDLGAVRVQQAAGLSPLRAERARCLHTAQLTSPGDTTQHGHLPQTAVRSRAVQIPVHVGVRDPESRPRPGFRPCTSGIGGRRPAGGLVAPLSFRQQTALCRRWGVSLRCLGRASKTRSRPRAGPGVAAGPGRLLQAQLWGWDRVRLLTGASLWRWGGGGQTGLETKQGRSRDRRQHRAGPGASHP